MTSRKLLSTGEAGEILGLSRWSVIYHANEGNLPVAARFGGRDSRMFREQDVRKFKKRMAARKVA